MKLRFDESVEEFRAEFLQWLDLNRPSDQEMADDPARSSGHSPGWARAWTRRMFEGGWLVPGWPPHLGGRNAAPIETLVYLEELNRSEVPRTTNPQGLGIVAPSLVDYGTAEQIDAYAMPLLRGELTACLGMSEPDAGSDLANLKTRALLDGDRFVINGQKVWTSGAGYADFCFLFCRTDPDAPKHRGISIVLLPLDTEGVTIRPLKEIVHPEYPDLSEVFLDDVIVPVSNLVGELNDGWKMAGGSLAHERSMVWLNSVMGVESAMAQLLEMAPEIMAPLNQREQVLAADDIVGFYVEAQCARALGYRGFARFVKGGTAPEQALMKMYASELRRDLGRVAAAWCGPASLAITDGRRSDLGLIEGYFATFGSTISAGSSEIQRNIIAERILNLPRG
ncbi:MAG: acyl-CoA dehydrogenase [Acidimicrobiaceae bacterium]|nr:acyl-CoA dehydrogenase [Acidimicrobiaceae bacterium]MYG55961.1 acyl-CoA dehydrogenase [Acidimicrobiaceae bacterium]MYJ97857.1 acyl-CoA dehydrogenase [Acidimicrobiaceae bacterium]